jgi:hypothetical protein
MILKAFRIEAFRQLLIRGLQPPDFTPPSPQPYHAWHGYRVTIAHHEEVGVSAVMHASALPSGAAAAAPPAGSEREPSKS